MQIKEQIGERFKEERKLLGISQTELAESLGASRRSIIDWEKGVATANAEVLSSFHKLGADILYILTGKREHKKITSIDDKDRLQLAIEAVEEGLEAIQKKLPANKKAELIVAAYDLITEPGNAGEKVVKLIRLVA
ncbi:MAG: helix-turn-helix transcriptional regulator [Gammaproteobacteria bacterium]|nr:MAG: helix-turn-helix transcriptional regulator [Gammaproteobacteria bacterium]